LKKTSLFFILFFFFGRASEAPVDGLLAVVGKNIILHTDVFQQSQIIAMQRGLDVSRNPLLFEKIYNETLSNMVDQYVLLAAAEKDTTIQVSGAEVDAALEQQMSEIVSRAGSVSALEEVLGQPIKKIKKDYWEEIKNMILIDRFRYGLFSNVAVTRKEVQDFYSNYKDSLPLAPAKIKFSLIEIPYIVGKNTRVAEFNFISELKSKIENGERFEGLAQEFSQDPGSASVGGDLGYMNRGTLVSEYEEAAFSLDINEISEPILSPFGYHLIQLLDKRGESIHTRHILRFLKPSEEDKEVALKKIRQIYNDTEHDPGLFDSLAQEFKYDLNNSSGVFPPVDINTIPSDILLSIQDVPEYNISLPFESQNESVYIAYVFEKKESVKPTLENSWETINELAKNNKMNSVLLGWLNENRGTTFIKIFHQ